MKSLSLLRAILVTGALLIPLGLQAQEERWERVEQAYSAEWTAEIRELVREAARQGVPPEPLLDKALEGAAKGVAPSLVLGALSDYSGRLGRARALVGASESRAELVAAADALQRGVPEDVIRGAAAEPGDDAIALVVLGDLVEMGVPVARAEEVVADALDRGARGERLLTVPAAVRRLIREGVLPPEAVTRVQEAMSRGGVPGQIPGGAGPGAAPGANPPVSPPVPPGAGPPEGRGRPPGSGGPPGGG